MNTYAIVVNKRVKDGVERPFSLASIAVKRDYDETFEPRHVVSAELAFSHRQRPDGTFTAYLPLSTEARNTLQRARNAAQAKIVNARYDRKADKYIGTVTYGGKALPDGLLVVLTMDADGNITQSTLAGFPVTVAGDSATVKPAATEDTMSRILTLLEGQAKEIAALKAAK